MSHNYFCSLHECDLLILEQELVCPIGNHAHKIDNLDIPILDEICSSEAFHFDSVYNELIEINQNEINKFNSVASIFMRTLPPPSNADYQILDVACGTGLLSLFLASKIFPFANFFCFDHSYKQIQICAKTAHTLNLKNINPSVQDVHDLKFRASFFDFVLGNAVLHHFLDFKEVLVQLLKLLKPGGKMVFAEPFYPGYLIIINIIDEVIKELKLDDNVLSNPAYGLLTFIKDDIRNRIAERHNPSFLQTLVDKHLFSNEDFLHFANDNDLEVKFSLYEDCKFYKTFMSNFLKAYGVTDPQFVLVSEQFYEAFYSKLETNFGSLYPHFQLIELMHRNKE